MTKIIVKTLQGEAAYQELPSFSDLMLARDDPDKKIVFVDGRPTIVDRKKRKKK